MLVNQDGQVIVSLDEAHQRSPAVLEELRFAGFNLEGTTGGKVSIGGKRSIYVQVVDFVDCGC